MFRNSSVSHFSVFFFSVFKIDGQPAGSENESDNHCQEIVIEPKRKSVNTGKQSGGHGKIQKSPYHVKERRRDFLKKNMKLRIMKIPAGNAVYEVRDAVREKKTR
jgi:hypothetical protein